MRIKVMTYNIRHGRGSDNRQRFSRIIDQVSNTLPDIVGINEMDCYNPRSKWQNQPKRLAKALGYSFLFHPTINIGFAKYGNGLFTKWDILDHKLHSLPSRGEPRGCIEAVVAYPLEPLRVMVTHLGLNDQEQISQLERLAEIVKSQSLPTILMGDFNRSSNTLIDILGLNDTHTDEKGFGYTFPAHNPSTRIDYIFSSSEFLKEKNYCLKTLASDHLPVVSLLKVERMKSDEQ